MRINWNALAAIAPLFIVILGWAISIEVRMSQHANIETIQNEINAMKLEEHQERQTISNQINSFTTEVRGLVRRIQNLEEILTPMLVDYKVRKELEKSTPAPNPAPAPAPPTWDRATPSLPKFSLLPNPSQSPIEKEAEKWAKEAIQKGQQLKGKPEAIKKP